MTLKTKKAFKLKHSDRLTVLADKGYHTGEQLNQCHQNNISTLVAAPRKRKVKDNSKPDHLTKDNFIYDKKTNSYTCPEGQVLKHQNTYTRKKKGLLIGAPFDRYKADWDTCTKCPQFDQCVSKGNKNRKQGRYIDRVLTDDAVLKNKRMISRRKKLYRQRQDIVEHPFGTIKRQWGYDHTLMKTIPKVLTEFSIITLCYNIRRAMSILGIEELKMALNELSLVNLTMSALMKRLMQLFQMNVYDDSQSSSRLRTQYIRG